MLISAEIFPTDDYAIYQKDKAEGEGGVFIAVKHNIGSEEEISLDSNSQILWCIIQRKNAPLLYIGSFYRPPTHGQNHIETLDQLSLSLDKLT